jgi:cytochrome c oxidase subunit 3
MIRRDTIDVSALPDHAFGSRSIMWWSTMTLIGIEATIFVLAISAHFYLQGNEETWPPPNTALPHMFWGSLNVAVLLLSLIPNELTKRAAEELDLRKVRLWLSIATAFSLAFCLVRVVEFRQLAVSWDSNAYGSSVWTLLGLHTVHLVTDLIDSVVLTVMMFTRHGEQPRRFVDVAENAFYWYFVVLSWIPIYLVIYWAPRWL